MPKEAEDCTSGSDRTSYARAKLHEDAISEVCFHSVNTSIKNEKPSARHFLSFDQARRSHSAQLELETILTTGVFGDTAACWSK